MADPVTLAVIGITAQVGSGILGAAGEAKADSFKSAQAAQAARYGKIQAAETDTAIRENLSDVVSNIRAIRASSGISADSPTTTAIIENETKMAERERRIRVNSILGQVGSDEASSQFFKTAAGDAFLYGTLGSFAQGFKSFASL